MAIQGLGAPARPYVRRDSEVGITQRRATELFGSHVIRATGVVWDETAKWTGVGERPPYPPTTVASLGFGRDRIPPSRSLLCTPTLQITVCGQVGDKRNASIALPR